MTAPIIRVSNPSGGLVLSGDNSFGLNYIGRATPYSLVGASGTITSGIGRKSGASVYRITSVNRPVPFFALALNVNIAMRGVTYIGANVWEITAFTGSTTLDDDNFNTIVYVDVFCFAQPVSHTGVGLKIMDPTGSQLRWSVTDTSGQLLFLKGALDLAGSAGELDTNNTIVSLTSPAVLGMPQSTATNSSIDGAFFDCRELEYGWQRTAANTLVQANYYARRYRDDGGITPTSSPEKVSALFIETSGLP